MLLENYKESYRTDYHIEWGFCRYFWECHILFPDIDFVELTNEHEIYHNIYEKEII